MSQILLIEDAVRIIVEKYRGDLNWYNFNKKDANIDEIELPAVFVVAAPAGLAWRGNPACKFRKYMIDITIVHDAELACKDIQQDASGHPVAQERRYRTATENFTGILECIWDLLSASKSPYDIEGDLDSLMIHPEDEKGNPNGWLGLAMFGEVLVPYKRGMQSSDFAPMERADYAQF